MSILIIAFSSLNNSLASFFAKYVLPTPVGPTNTNDPIGLLGFLSPTRALLIALEIESMALSCPMTTFFKLSAKNKYFCDSDSVSLDTGTFAQRDTIFAISSNPISNLFSSWSSSSISASTSLMASLFSAASKKSEF